MANSHPVLKTFEKKGTGWIYGAADEVTFHDLGNGNFDAFEKARKEQLNTPDKVKQMADRIKIEQAEAKRKTASLTKGDVIKVGGGALVGAGVTAAGFTAADQAKLRHAPRMVKVRKYD
ncbi:hypothetical protein FRB94_013272 [Tulasnella sp. JGI-2019a]|nr:hypothetical protein FRB94_013272 [Tulasnella sp. JGI-2019a]